MALALCAVALAELSGCSGGKQAAKNAKGPSPATGAASPTAPAAAPTTAAPTPASFTGQDSAAFCRLARTYSDQSKNVGPTATPAQLRAAVTDGRAAITQAVNAASAEIKADVQVLASAFGDLADAFEKANYDATRFPVSALEKLQSPEFQASTVRFQSYIRSVCGIAG